MNSTLKSTNIPLVNLKSLHDSLEDEISEAISKVVSKSHFIQGEEVKLFESEFANYCTSTNVDAKTQFYCASCGNGTDAIELALMALNIKPGDEVITVSHTFFASVEAILSVGAKPVFVDIDPDTMLMDESLLEQKITPKTKAILVVQLYGQSCNMEAISEFAKKHQLYIVEDAAQAHGATWNGRGIGYYGDLATFSFFPGKNLGAFGDAGAVISRDDGLIKRVKRLSNHGRESKYEHLIAGRNSRMDNLQAAILRVKLRYLHDWNAQREEIAYYYLDHLKNLPLKLPTIHALAKSVWHLFVIQVENRDEILSELKSNKIMAGIHYPIPLHKQPALSEFVQDNVNLPQTEKVAQKIISLPLFPQMTFEEVDMVIAALKGSLKQ